MSEKMIEDEAISCSLICMISETSGILRNDYNLKNLCYFEIQDVNLAQPLNLVDLVMILRNNIPGIRIRYQGTKVPSTLYSSGSSSSHQITSIANLEGVQVTGILPNEFKHIKILDAAKSSIGTNSKSPKFERWQKAERAVKRDDIIHLRKILDGTYIKKTEIPKKPESLRKHSGKVRNILNENFGLVQSTSLGFFCLFDTFDLYVSKTKTAADAQLNVSNVFAVDMDVTFDACLIENEYTVPYLVTGVWKTNSEDTPDPTPVSKNAIQKDKINVYQQVAKSCDSIIKSKKKETMKNSDKKNINFELDIHKRKEQITETCQTINYLMYKKAIPNISERHPQEPKTPDPYDHNAWDEKLSDWRTSLEEWVRKNESKDELVESECTGEIYKHINENYALIKLNNGHNALLMRSRIWCGNRPLTGPWRLLSEIERNKIIRINARKVNGTNAKFGFDYQILYCHTLKPTSAHGRLFFNYSYDMKHWIHKKIDHIGLDNELKNFIRFMEISGYKHNKHLV